MKIVQLQQGSREWINWRFDGIGASDMPAIVGESPYMTREVALFQKAVRLEPEVNFAMRRGTNLEPIIRKRYELYRNVLAPSICCEHDNFPWCRASPDGVVGPLFKPSEIAEFKAPRWDFHDEACAGIVPIHYRAQVQWLLFVTGAPMAHYVSFNNGKKIAPSQHLAIVKVEADPVEQERLFTAAKAFWTEVCMRRQQQLATV